MRIFFNNITKTVLIIISVAFASNVIYRFYNKKKRKERPEINEVIMFSSNNSLSLKQNKYSRQQVTQSFNRLLYYLNSPRASLDVCMYVITNMDCANGIIKLHNRGIKVRVILDADMAFSTGSIIKRLDKQNIPVRWRKSTFLMHHKFCLIDSRDEYVEKSTPTLIMGSLNWTNQALNGNWEDVVVTTQKDLVRQYKTEFERLWIEFKPIVK